VYNTKQFDITITTSKDNIHPTYWVYISYTQIKSEPFTIPDICIPILTYCKEADISSSMQSVILT